MVSQQQTDYERQQFIIANRKAASSGLAQGKLTGAAAGPFVTGLAALASIGYALHAPNQSDLDLPPHGELACSATFARSHPHRKYRVRYLGVEVDDALEIAERIEV